MCTAVLGCVYSAADSGCRLAQLWTGCGDSGLKVSTA